MKLSTEDWVHHLTRPGSGRSMAERYHLKPEASKMRTTASLRWPSALVGDERHPVDQVTAPMGTGFGERDAGS